MEYRKFPQGYVLRLDPGEEVVECLTRLVRAGHLSACVVSATMELFLQVWDGAVGRAFTAGTWG